MSGASLYKCISDSERQTETIGERLAKTIKRGCVIALFGELGAGKTAFTRGLIKGFGSHDRVSSPTYNIVNEYSCEAFRLCHFDMYRLKDSSELYDIGWEDYVGDTNAVCIIEWSERVSDAIPGDAVIVRITKCEDDCFGRIIEIENAEM